MDNIQITDYFEFQNSLSFTLSYQQVATSF